MQLHCFCDMTLTKFDVSENQLYSNSFPQLSIFWSIFNPIEFSLLKSLYCLYCYFKTFTIGHETCFFTFFLKSRLTGPKYHTEKFRFCSRSFHDNAAWRCMLPLPAKQPKLGKIILYKNLCDYFRHTVWPQPSNEQKMSTFSISW